MLIISHSTFLFPNWGILILRINFATETFPVNVEASFQKQFALCIFKFGFLKYRFLVNSLTKSRYRWASNTLKSSLPTEKQLHSRRQRAYLACSLLSSSNQLFQWRERYRKRALGICEAVLLVKFYFQQSVTEGSVLLNHSFYLSVPLFRREHPFIQIVS